MHTANIFSLSLLLLAVVKLSTGSGIAETDNSIETKNLTSGRSGRKDYSSPVYSPPDTYSSDNFYPSDNADNSPRFKPRLQNDDVSSTEAIYQPTAYEEYIPISQYRAPNGPMPRYYGPDWKVWNGDQMDSSATSNVPNNNKGGQPPNFGDFYFPQDNNWKGDAFMPDQMPAMMMMMQQMNKPKLGGFLSKLKQDPTVFLIVAILPLSLIMAAVLPTFVNMMMNGGLPTVTTVASGNKGRNLDNAEFLKPVIQTISTFGARSFDNPECMQKIFCQVTRGPSSSSNRTSESRSFQKTLYAASRLIDSNWLESFGVKTLFDSMKDGNCDKIPCLTSHKADAAKKHS